MSTTIRNCGQNDRMQAVYIIIFPSGAWHTHEKLLIPFELGLSISKDKLRRHTNYCLIKWSLAEDSAITTNTVETSYAMIR